MHHAQFAQILLASGSPRRRAMLEGAGISYVVRPQDIDETPVTGEDPEAYALRMAKQKALLALGTLSEDDPPFVLASDTVVTLDGNILGKPKDADDAAHMLRLLSGRAHSVITSFAIASREGLLRLQASHTVVHFRQLSEDEIAAYIATGEPMDKAGAYGIQGAAGLFVQKIEGSYDTVVGLPLCDVCSALTEVGALQGFPYGIAARLRMVQGRIKAAAVAAGRDPREITLIGVSKLQPIEALREAVACGLCNLGENYVQEWRDKAFLMGPGVVWHLIGGLQRNKAKYIDARVALVHSVDSLSLGEALAKAARTSGRRLPILAQINQGAESTKSGVLVEDAAALVQGLAQMEDLDLRGLMTLPPPGAGAADTRPYFAALRKLRDELATPDLPLPELSMGMSADYEAAIAEGATMVRVGSSIFGPRH